MPDPKLDMASFTDDITTLDALARPVGGARADRTRAAARHHSAREVSFQRDRRYRNALVTADVVAALLLLAVTSALSSGTRVTLAFIAAVPLIVGAAKLHGLYDRDGLLVRRTTIDESPAYFRLAAVFTLLTWLADDVVLGGSMTTVQALALWVGMWTVGIVLRRLGRAAAASSVAPERLLLVGDAATYVRIADKLENGRVNARLVGRLSMQRVSHTVSEERPVDEGTLAVLLGDLDVERVLVVPSQTNPQVTLDLVRAIKAIDLRVSIVPHVLDVVGNSVVFDDLGGMTILGVRPFGLSRSSRLLKRAFDVTGSLVGLVLLAPVFALIGLAIRLGSRGPVFFRQDRIGRDGATFRIYKFRSMVADAEARKAGLADRNDAAAGFFKITDDPRITRIGRVLRSTSLDELPQLINVLRGEMSLVGPRPLIASEDDTITGYDRQRLALTPGMTGHWQIMGSSVVPMSEMVKIDYVYVTHWSVFEDFKILVRTVRYMLAAASR